MYACMLRILLSLSDGLVHDCLYVVVEASASRGT